MATSGGQSGGQLTGWRVRTVFTDASGGDLSIDAPAEALEARRSVIAPNLWTWLRQVHGDRVVVVTRPGEHAGTEADAAVTAVPGVVLAVQTADCAGVVLRGSGSPDDDDPVVVIGAAHAGWRGLVAGVLERTVDAMRELGAQRITWQLGPCISPAAYEFGAEDLEALVERFGPSLRGVTATGRPALDLRAGVRAALAGTGATEQPGSAIACTATDPGYFSWRARRDTARQSAVTWMEHR